LLLIGKADELLALYKPLGSDISLWNAFILDILGHHSETSTLVDHYLAVFGDTEPVNYTASYWFGIDIHFLEAAVMVGHKRAIEFLMKRCIKYSTLTTGFFYPTCIPRHPGAASALLGKYDEAREYYREAIKVCTEMRFRPALALACLQLAELLLEHYPDEKKEALERLDFAIKEFREMKMQPSLERALWHKDILKA
jgi:tetratricopeptide (TPR) repeat protein